MASSLTIKDIARLANVSQSTVSKALNGKPDVGETTKKRIIELAEKHQFTPSAFGKGLKRRFTENIGVIFRREKQPLSSNPFYSRVLEGIEAEIALNNYNLVLHMVPENQPPKLSKMVKEKQVDGVILVGTQNEEYIQLHRQTNMPIVLVDPKGINRDCSQILIDNENGAFLATQHLIQKGHRRIGFISNDISRLSFKQRLDGYLKAMRSANIPIDKTLIVSGGVESGYELTKTLLALPDRLTAIFAANDINAIYGYRAVHEANLSIPNDISFVGFDDIELSKIVTPPLTTIRVYKEELGSVAVRKLRELIHTDLPVATTMIIPVKLIERASVKAL